MSDPQGDSMEEDSVINNGWSSTNGHSRSHSQVSDLLLGCGSSIDYTMALGSRSYAFPKDKLKKVMDDPSKTPVVIIGCGSYSPVTYLHLRMFEMAHDFIIDHGQFELIGAYFSPVSSGYQKDGLANFRHRVAMCQLAVEGSSYIMVDPWEAYQPDWKRTAEVLDHFDSYVNSPDLNDEWGVLCNGTRRKCRIMLIAGGDLIESFAKIDVVNGVKIPVWSPQDLDQILGVFGCIIIERTNADVHAFLLKHQKLYDHRKSVYVVKQFIYNDISSTLVRLFIRRNMSIKYLLPDPVIDYIKEKKLYIVDEPRTMEQEIALLGEAPDPHLPLTPLGLHGSHNHLPALGIQSP